MRFFFYLGISCCFILSTGCAGFKSSRNDPQGSIASIVQASQHDLLEVSATPEDQARKEVFDTPTVFLVPFADDPYSWERARFFLENYIGGRSKHTSAVTRVVGDRWSLASNPAVENFSYEVTKDAADTGFTYRVSCVPGASGDHGQAALNAGNLARFIRDGKLEISLLSGR